MGIQGLLPFLKSIQRESHIKKWSGKTLAIDGYVWLHRGAYFCAQDLCLGKPTRKHVEYFTQRINLLTHNGVTPYVVFDGDHLPSKKITENERENRRRIALTNANRFLTQGDPQRAREEFIKAVDVTPQLAYDVIQTLRSNGIQFVVAPYEADAQLRYLEMKGQVDAIITEDSDLLVYGARNVLFKLDPGGNCIHICRDHLGLVDGKRMSLWSDGEFRQMAMLSGCDYLASIPGLGIKKSHELIRRFKTAERAIKATRLDGKLSVPLKYEQRFREAELTFLHQFVYDPSTRSMVPLNPFPEPPLAAESLAGCGQKWPDQVAIDVAEGRVDPLTKEAFLHKPSQRPLPLMTRDLNPSTSKHTSQKPLTVSSTNQPTLNKFVFRLPSSNPKIGSSSVKESAKHLPKFSENYGDSQESNEPEIYRDKPSKFFVSIPDVPVDLSCPISSEAANLDSQDFFATQTTIEDLRAEDVLPLTQDSWDAISQVSIDQSISGRTEPLNNDTAFEQFIEEDLPSSQMHDPYKPPRKPIEKSRSNLGDGRFSADDLSDISSLSSHETNRKPNSPSSCPTPSQEIDDQAMESLSDGCIQSSQPTITKPVVTIITPQNHSVSSMPLNFRRLSEPISRIKNQPHSSSDPIVSSDDDQIQNDRAKANVSVLNRRKANWNSQSEKPHKKACRGFTDTPSNYLSKAVKRASSSSTSRTSTRQTFDDDEVSPSLARIATGIRSRFMYQKPSSQRATVDNPSIVNAKAKLFDFSRQVEDARKECAEEDDRTLQQFPSSSLLSPCMNHRNSSSSNLASSCCTSSNTPLNRASRSEGTSSDAHDLDRDSDPDADGPVRMNDSKLRMGNSGKREKKFNFHPNPLLTNSMTKAETHTSKSTPTTNKKLSMFLFKGKVENYHDSSPI